MNGFGWAFLIVGLVSIYALGLLGYNLMLSAKKLSVQIEKSQELIAELNSFEIPIPPKLNQILEPTWFRCSVRGLDSGFLESNALRPEGVD